jgi:hypothetical protein
MGVGRKRMGLGKINGNSFQSFTETPKQTKKKKVHFLK